MLRGISWVTQANLVSGARGVARWGLILLLATMATLPPYCLAQGRSLQTGAAQTGAAQAAVAQAGASQTGAAQTSAVEGLISGGLKTPPPVLSLSDAWRFAMDSDPTLKAANAAALAGREQLPQAQAQLLPNVSMNASRYRNDVRR